MAFQEVGSAFAQHYYKQFDSNRANLHTLYRDNSMLTFEGQQFMGTKDIIEKLTGLPFAKVQHQVVTCDCQPATAVSPQGIMVFINGNLLIDDGANPMKFAQTFMLLPDPAAPGQYWVHNDIFRLNLG